jgi:2-(1,2-epoxy-1,2-dihydrophenyl)acetyl-CoA isomerase
VAEEQPIVHEVADGVARLTINAPGAGNSLTAAMRDRLVELLDDASASVGVRAVLLTGAGERHFCTGAQLGGARAAPDRPEGAPERALGDAARLIRRGWQRLVGAVLDCEKPVVAAVNGTAAGGGVHLALACDVVLMAEGARLIEIFVRRGIIPDAGGAYLLPRLVGLQKAKELMFLGDDVHAADAERLGLANQVVPAAELATTADRWAARLAASPTKALTMTKWLLNRSFESSRATAFEEEAYAQELVNATDDAREGLTAFTERRPPAFQGW